MNQPGSSRQPPELSRFWEGPGDFPFYRGQPVALAGRQWLFVMLMVALGFLSLVAPLPLFRQPLGQLIPALLFAGIPLAALALVAGPAWRALFRPVGLPEIRLMLGFALLNILVTFAVGLLVYKLLGTNANPAVTLLAGMDHTERLLFFLKTLPQLLGEEVFTILPFLALLHLGTHQLRLSRGSAVLLATLLSALLFALVHLPTYGWNLLQCLLVIGSARLVLTLAYLRTRNLWVSTGAHIINDWTLFGLAILGSGLGQA